MFDKDKQIRRLLATSALAASSLATAVVPVAAAPAGAALSISVGTHNSAQAFALATGSWIDTSQRATVLASYDAEFGSAAPDIGWTGDRASCTAGTTSASYRQAVLDRVNWFRAMAGVPANVTENRTLSAQAQQTSLMSAQSGKLSHSPGEDFTCSTTVAVATASLSNLYLGRSGPDAIDGYIEDPGQYNNVVGHRNWVLSPTLTELGTGDIPATGGWSANTLKVIEHTSIVFADNPAMRQAEQYIAWPPEGYVPSQVVFDRWSFSLRAANFGSASVSATIDGQPTAVGIEYRSTVTTGAPFPIMVWNIPALADHPAQDTVVRISINGVSVNGSAKSFSYDTIVIGDTVPVSNDAFIVSAFQDFLGRQPTGAELETWRMKLVAGTSRLDFVSAMAQSPEWTTVVVQNLYLDTLGRRADASGASYWASRLQNGTSVATVASQFYGSAEYVSAEGGTWQAWLDDLYRELMGRSPDSAGLGYWVAQSEARGSGQVAYDFYQSGESRRARVDALYQKFLGRSPDAGGLAYWAGVLNSGDDLALAGFLASSDEYFAKAG